MPAHLIDGKAIGAVVRAGIRDRGEGFSARTGIKPCLAAVLVGCTTLTAVHVTRLSEVRQPTRGADR